MVYVEGTPGLTIFLSKRVSILIYTDDLQITGVDRSQSSTHKTVRVLGVLGSHP